MPVKSLSCSLHSLPTEVLERVLLFSDPRDVSTYSRTCRFARNLVYSPKDQYLWRELYLGRPYDDLRKAITTPKDHHVALELPLNSQDSMGGLSWTFEVQRRAQAELIAASGTRDAVQLEIAYAAILSAIDTAIPVEPNEGKPESAEGAVVRSDNLRWVDRLLRKTRLLDVIPSLTVSVVTISALGGPSRDNLDHEEDESQAIPDSRWLPLELQKVHQMRARLRTYVALSHETNFEARSRERMARIRKASRAFVYDMRKYQPSTLWGPFRVAQDGRTVLVNWEHVEHIVNVVSLKLRDTCIANLGYHKKPPYQMDALRAYSAIDAFKRPEGDWAGVTGTWRRFVCFMDYRDLNMFNYSQLSTGPHDPDFFDDPFDEALRPVELELELISSDEYFSQRQYIAIEPSTPVSLSSSSHGGPIGDYEEPAFPTLYFKGGSRGGAHSAGATIRGKVSTLSDGGVRWQFVTTYDGRMQWSAEAVQIGHVCSAAGVAGIWTGAHHDRDDPAGPFWMVKVNDQLPPGILNTLH
ncbi:hypothetical protein C8Q74DRAFT_1206311 [Fomes fomentarius]|nr:hypothetical protein C8Q74DRAFT_1206311 [Fomes fomentarius]